MAQTPIPSDNNPEPDDTRASDDIPEPTEQLPMESLPVYASAAASRGATGLDSDEFMDSRQKLLPMFGRHPLATAIGAGVIAVILVSGLTAWGVSTAVSASLTSSTSETPMAMPTATPTAGGTATTGRLAFRATIQSIDSGSWAILTKKGKTVTVMVNGATQFGTKKVTATAGSFAVGDSVIIVAANGTNGMPIATRIVKAPTGS